MRAKQVPTAIPVDAGPIDKCLLYRDDVYNFVFRMTYDKSLSEDIVQDTFVSALAHIGRFRGESSLKTWIIAIAKNETFKHIRNKKRDIRRIESIRRAENKKRRASVIDEYEETAYVEQIKNGCLFALLTCLPFSQRCVFILHALSDMPIGSVAEILVKSENATRILLSRAKATIRQFLCEHCEHITETPRCTCLGMLNFSISNKLIEKMEKANDLERVRKRFRIFKNEVELLKSLPYMAVRGKIFADPAYADIFFLKVK
jgi:RNA polymerase sigma-70 factor (ECF subfamily)